MMRATSCVLVAALAIGCSSTSVEEEPSVGGVAELTSTSKAVPVIHCAIATFDGPSYFAQNFATYQDAKKWLSTLSTATTSTIEATPCARPIACPMVYVPLCASVSGAEAATFGNSCELLAATRMAAGDLPPGAAKGAFLHDGECKAKAPSPVPPGNDVCSGKKCGETCPSMFGSPLPTYCNAKGECAPGKPICEAAYDCDRSTVKCDALEPSCPDGMTVSVSGGCYGPCVPITSCKCSPGSSTSCPDGWVCHASTNRCGPYVK